MKGIQNTSSKTYRQLMGNGLRYETPKFQRDYTWEEEQWDDLWQDIKSLLNNEETEHYMGYLMLQTSNNKSFEIIDGQQRLTTLSILILAVLKCLKDLIEAGTEADENIRRKDSLYYYIGSLDPITLLSNTRLKLNRNSDDYYRQHIVVLEELPFRNTNDSQKHLRDCFNWYYKMIKAEYKSGKDLASFIEQTVDKLFFTVIEVSDQINAFKIFETLNARGVQLSSSDLLKNYLFSVVDEVKSSTYEIDELESYWAQILSKLGEQKIEDYLRYYWNSEHKTVGKRNLFKTIKDTIQTKESVFALVRDLNKTADLYMALQSPEDEFWRERPELKEVLWELKLFQIKQTNSLFISGYKHLEAKQFEKLVKVCSIISFRYNIIGGLNPNAQEVVYNSISLKIITNKTLDLNDFSPIYVDDNKFENDFSNKEFKSTTRNHKIVKYLLSKIEWNKNKNEILPESDIFTIEHILPESADENWGEFNSEEIKRSVYRIGNLTLLEKQLNRDAGDKSYEEKKHFYNQSKCILTKNLSEHYDTWSLSKLGNRQRELAKAAKSIWAVSFGQ